jgi:hypothetical protein
LTINVFRPAGLSSGARLPVMAWIYGGGFLGLSLFLSFPQLIGSEQMVMEAYTTEAPSSPKVSSV